MTATRPSKKTPAEIARQVLQELALRRIAPTPDAYAKLYKEFESSQHHGDFNIQVMPSRPDTSSPAADSATEDTSSSRENLLRQMLARILIFSISSLLHDAPELASESRELGEQLQQPDTDLEQLFSRLKQLAFQIELQASDLTKQRELMLQLFSVLLENAQALLKKGSWLSNQISGIQTLFATDDPDLDESGRILKDMLFKQEQMRTALEEEKTQIRNMVMTFMDRLGLMLSATDHYHQALDSFQDRMQDVEWVTNQDEIVKGILAATSAVQKQAREAHDQMVHAENAVHDAENRIFELESQLQQMNDLIREDHLTGSLNRRGMDECLEKEIYRSQRHKTPLCVALIDLDNFKKLNDQHGHTVGDEVLIHLVSTVKDLLRTMDAIARFGGEEFVIIMPETHKEVAFDVMTRVQREMTKRVFLHNSQHLLITFSAGLAQYIEGESAEQLIERADTALYQAKNTGKNRVVIADDSILIPATESK